MEYLTYTIDELAYNTINGLIDKGYRFNVNYNPNIKSVDTDEIAEELVRKYYEEIERLEIR